MTSPDASTSTPDKYYRDRMLLPVKRAPNAGGRALLPPSSSGAITRQISDMTAITSTTTAPPRPLTHAEGRAVESELIRSFDPMKNLHLWTMWRVAVNKRIVEAVRKKKRTEPSREAGFDHNPFGQSLVKPPLKRLIRVENGSHKLATCMMDPHGQGGEHLAMEQFVFYGIPRVVLKKPKNVVQLP